jgi:hypothetical protein
MERMRVSGYRRTSVKNMRWLGDTNKK